MAKPAPLSSSLGLFSIRSLDRLNHASDLLAAAAQALDRLSSPAGLPIRELVYQANQEILAVMAKPARKFQLWHQRNKPEAIADEDA